MRRAMFDLAGKVVVSTGANNGIGLAAEMGQYDVRTVNCR